MTPADTAGSQLSHKPYLPVTAGLARLFGKTE
jgi:hypothetical protein